MGPAIRLLKEGGSGARSTSLPFSLSICYFRLRVCPPPSLPDVFHHFLRGILFISVITLDELANRGRCKFYHLELVMSWDAATSHSKMSESPPCRCLL